MYDFFEKLVDSECEEGFIFIIYESLLMVAVWIDNACF